MLAPKIGSIVRYCKYALFKDIIALVLKKATPLECFVHRRVPCVMLSCAHVGSQKLLLCVQIVSASAAVFLQFVNAGNSER